MIGVALALAVAVAPAAPSPAAFRLPAREVKEAFDRMEGALMSDPDISYHPRSGVRYSSAKCRMTEDPRVALCRFRVTTDSGKSRKITNHFRRFDDDRWIANLEL